MLTAISCIVIILSFSVLPFMFSVKLNVDVFSNKGEIKLDVFFIPVYRAEIKFQHDGALKNNLVIQHGKKSDEIHLNADKSDSKSVVTMFRAIPIMSYVIFERLCFDAKIGFNNDAFFTTMTAGVARSLFYAFASFLKSRQQITIEENISPQYNANELDFDVFGILKLSIANIINSFFASLLTKAKNKGVI